MMAQENGENCTMRRSVNYNIHQMLVVWSNQGGKYEQKMKHADGS
jgi:hypothetical protein